ncbi:DUF2515 family protein [Roseobacter weihaiensis]|uniref:DUF2515 family protein n=1 Tax=Roseobacter weihaiensis TaxID=2763262 RepID=UPI001D09C80C|nr:hypothetical protein [Roseobacter sp. H9]
MNDFSTTQVPDSPIQQCPSNCREAMDMVMEDVNRITRIDDAVDRNVAITEAYKDLGAAMPNNHWVRLAGYVSTQGGCAMKNFYPSENFWMGMGAQTFGRAIVNPSEALDALRDANTTIFTSVYPPNKFMHDCGYERLKQCVDSGVLDVDDRLMDALKEVDRGNLAEGADIMAEHEQMDVVQPVYERHKDTFDDMVTADGWVPGDQTSIPVAYECTRDDLVPLGDLEIQKPRDRVKYYRKLMDRMREIEGL